jgi:hypothetical protein
MLVRFDVWVQSRTGQQVLVICEFAAVVVIDDVGSDFVRQTLAPVW